MKPGLVTEHRRWIKAQRRKHAALPVASGMEIDGECACGNCACLGNNACGHECLDADNNCTLMGDGTCPCCMIESAPLTDAQEDALTGQGALFANKGATFGAGGDVR